MDPKSLKQNSLTTQKGECPICCQIPRANIYQCINGHSLCDICSSKLKICPTCRSDGVKIRNLLAESLLDDIKFKCSWSEQGCSETMLRSELSAHEKICKQNPQIIELCSFFSNHREICHYKFSSKRLSETENYMDIISHMTTHHAYKFNDNVEIGKSYTAKLRWKFLSDFMNSVSKPALYHNTPIFHRFQNKLGGGAKEQIFFRILLVKCDKSGNKSLSWAFVQLTPEIAPVTLRITLNSNASSKMMSQWGQQSVSTLSWIVKPISFDEFKKMAQVPETCFPFSLPVSFVSDYYINDQCLLISTFKFELKD